MEREPEREWAAKAGESQREITAGEQRASISAHVVYRAVLAEGETELKRPTSALGFSGLAAGLSMGFSFLSEGLIRSHLPEEEWTPLVSNLGYPMGFLIVILGRQQLFTENTLTPVLPLLKYKSRSILVDTLRLWTTVFLANWIGTIAFAWVLGHANVVEGKVPGALQQIGEEAMRHGFATTVVKAIFAGWLIALLVWLLPFAEAGRILVIILITYVISLGGFSHVIAGSVDTFYLVALGQKSWGDYLGGFLAPTLLGNILGGVALVAALNHAQVTAGGQH